MASDVLYYKDLLISFYSFKKTSIFILIFMTRRALSRCELRSQARVLFSPLVSLKPKYSV